MVSGGTKGEGEGSRGDPGNDDMMDFCCNFKNVNMAQLLLCRYLFTFPQSKKYPSFNTFDFLLNQGS